MVIVKKMECTHIYMRDQSLANDHMHKGEVNITYNYNVNICEYLRRRNRGIGNYLYRGIYDRVPPLHRTRSDQRIWYQVLNTQMA